RCAVPFSLALSPTSSPICRRPPRPPLFPYTTLFRSGHLPQTHQEGHHAAHARRGLGRVAPRTRRRRTRSRHHLRRRRRPPRALRDRKSTRLNSSHVSISYAVFCLKKKNNDHLRPLHE